MMNRQGEIDDQLKQNKRRTDEHEFILFKFQKRVDIEAEQEQRMQKMEQEVKMQHTQMKNLVEDEKV